MMSDQFQSALHQFVNGSSRRLKSFMAMGLGMLLLASGGCESWSSFNSAFSPAPLELAIVQVEPENSGSYSVSGTTTLPEKTQLTVSAVRLFQDKVRAGVTNMPTNYSILDRQMVEVNQGAWETQLNLWRNSANGQSQEAWQVKLDADQYTQPEPTVTFLATLEPANQPIDLKKQVEALERTRQVTLKRFTTDGELYLQAVKIVPIPPPQGQASVTMKAVNQPVQSKPKEVRFKSESSQAGASQTGAEGLKQTDMPLSPDAFVR